MKNNFKKVLGSLAVALTLFATGVSAQSIGQLQQFTSTTSPSAAITQTTYGKAIKITGLSTGLCLTLDSNNILTTTSCGSGGGGTPGGLDTQVQFNDGGNFGGNAAAIFNKATGLTTLSKLTVTSATSTSATTTNLSILGDFWLNGQRFTNLLGTGLIDTSGALTVTLSPFSTTNLSEGSNLYYTQGRFDAALAATTTLPNLAVLTGLTDVIATRSTTTSATTTNFFSTTASSTNLFTSLLDVGTTLTADTIVSHPGATMTIGVGTNTAGGGSLTISAGSSSVSGAGGDLTLRSGGVTSSSKIGDINIQIPDHPSGTSGNQGDINLIGGLGGTSGTSARGSNINLTAGSYRGSNTSTAGGIVLLSGNTSGASGTASGVITLTTATPVSSTKLLGSGAISLTTGDAGPNSSAGGTAGDAGTLGLFAGAGGASTAATGGTAGNGANISIAAGNGGNATGSSGTRNGGNAGNIVLTAGTAGTGATANGTAGLIELLGGKVGIGTAAPTHSLTLNSTGTGIALYNTADQTTNYERIVTQWSSNQAQILYQGGGTGAARTLAIGAQNPGSGNYVGLKVNRNASPFISYGTYNSSFAATGLTITAGDVVRLWEDTGLVGPASGQVNLVAIKPVYNQTTSTGILNTDFLINRTETSLGTTPGIQRLIDAQVGGTTKFNVSDTGQGYFADKLGVGTTSPYALLSVGGDAVIGAATAGGTLGDLYLPKLGTAAGSFIAVDAAGKVVATSTPINTGGSTQGVNWATSAVLAGTPTYSNGSSGVGATLTEVGTGALSVDGNAPVAGDRVLVKNQASAFQNGIYSVTATGSGIASYLLTRATDYNAPTEITPGLTTYVVSGTVNNDSTFAVSYTSPLTIGTTNLTYTELAGGGAAVASVSNSDSTLTISPTSGAVVASLNLAHANTWTGGQTFGNSTTTTASFTTASTTNQYVSSLGAPAGTFVAADPSGKLIATSTPSSGTTIGSVLKAFPQPVGPGSHAFANGGGTGNTTLHVGQVFVQAPITLNKVSFIDNGITTTGSVKLAMYSSDGQTQYFSTSTPIVTSITHTATTTSPVTLTPGVYYFAYLLVSTTNLTVISYNTAGNPQLDSKLSVADPVQEGTLTVTADTMPATIDPTAISQAGSQIPVFRLDN